MGYWLQSELAKFPSYAAEVPPGFCSERSFTEVIDFYVRQSLCLTDISDGRIVCMCAAV